MEFLCVHICLVSLASDWPTGGDVIAYLDREKSTPSWKYMYAVRKQNALK